MSDKFTTFAVERLLKWILEEERCGQVFGIAKELFFEPSAADRFCMERYGQVLETPLGVAAGPHTQMTQNIIAAWLTGARYIELKTVQTLDELDVSKPCIDMEDEGYNCEWSQELKLHQSFHQYLDAWILIHILRHKFNFLQGDSSPKSSGPGFIFNMSVGYNMEGILKPNVQWFLDKMENCRAEKEEKLDRLSVLYPAVKDLAIPDRISDNVTLSTMHGCPPDEIEKIARYLISERKYHTAVKMNPTLLGPERLREILNKELGFDTHVPDEAFSHDLTYGDAVNIIRSLKKTAAEVGVDFGLKLTNTLESVNHRDVLPENEKMMYLSGRALHPISINVAAKLQETFKGELDLSFSAGADCFNFADIIACGLRPVTVCSDILKPGGYGRLLQYLENLDTAIMSGGADSLDSFVKTPPEKLRVYAEAVVKDARYKKDVFPGRSIKTERDLHLFDCIQAPCQTSCPAHQGVPDYMYHTAAGDIDKAFETILNTNPFPTVTGMVCDHACMGKCTRQNYDNALKIRDIKRFAAENISGEPRLKPAPPIGVKVAVIGAGPSGLSCAFYLALRGVEVDIYENRSVPGGMVSDAIPVFRLTDRDIRRDIHRIEALGVTFHCNHHVDKVTFQGLRESHDYIYIAVGAPVSSRLGIEGEDSPHVMDALTFLKKVRRNEAVDLGKRVAIVGGGNSAMDAARTAKRLLDDPGGEVVVLYRRTRNEMPANPEEIEAVKNEGITIIPLTNPGKITQTPAGANNKRFRGVQGVLAALFQKEPLAAGGRNRLNVSCWKMRLGEKDESGRRRPVKIDGSEFDLPFDTVIPAIGQLVVLDFLEQPLRPDESSGRTQLPNIFMGGDALHGALNIITAVADGKRAADAIMAAGPLFKEASQAQEPRMTMSEQQQRTVRRIYGETAKTIAGDDARKEASRCLLCSDICNVCVTVCPNRANIFYTVPQVEYKLQMAVKKGGDICFEDDGIFRVEQRYQVLNIADSCNECGNCRTFCPSRGAPYKDKPKLCLTAESFREESTAYYLEKVDGNRRISFKKDGLAGTLRQTNEVYVFETEDVTVRLSKEDFQIKDVQFRSSVKEVKLKDAAIMSILLRFVPDYLQSFPN